MSEESSVGQGTSVDVNGNSGPKAYLESRDNIRLQNGSKGRWNGVVQGFKRYWHAVVQVIVWILFFGFLAGSFWAYNRFHFQVYNLILVNLISTATAIAVTCSHAYNHEVRQDAPPIWNQAERQKALWLHANFFWQTVSVVMTIMPLYCTCVAIYLSGNNKSPENVMIHSIMSLVISLGVYVISPSSRATAYRGAYALVNDALMGYELDPEKGKGLLREAMDKGTRLVLKAEDGTRL